MPGFAWLKDDGTTACGNWIYCGAYTEAGNLTMRRDASDPSGMGVHQNWAWSWPANRRVLYNRASCNLDGKPWDPSRRQVWWSESAQKWVGNDVPDFKPDSKPADHMGPFIMNPEGVGRLFAPLGAFAEGPFPEFYEPTESPIENLLHPQQSHNPVIKRFKTPDDKYSTPQGGLHGRLHHLPVDRALSLLDQKQSHECAAWCPNRSWRFPRNWHRTWVCMAATK